ncbi:MAG TPA: WHG domain-containing protein [Steroidobacteraceae bacterium]|jgi:AcrR family transcriptional regulator|nr:WHG domain-containing protein [Steroidobacteraceae bacterium]
MGRRNEHSREELRDLALRAAADIVSESGATALSMREVARRIGYTVGALYIVFENLDDLIVGLNEQTVIELREALERIRGRANQPAQNLRLLVAAYLGFALLHTARWRLVFEHRLPEGQKAPPTYAGHTAAIFALVGRHLREAGVAKDDESARELATALWSGAHGICMLAVTGKLQIVTQASVQRLLDVLLDRFLGDGVAPRSSRKRKLG